MPLQLVDDPANVLFADSIVLGATPKTARMKLPKRFSSLPDKHHLPRLFRIQLSPTLSPSLAADGSHVGRDCLVDHDVF